MKRNFLVLTAVVTICSLILALISLILLDRNTTRRLINSAGNRIGVVSSDLIDDEVEHFSEEFLENSKMHFRKKDNFIKRELETKDKFDTIVINLESANLKIVSEEVPKLMVKVYENDLGDIPEVIDMRIHDGVLKIGPIAENEPILSGIEEGAWMEIVVPSEYMGELSIGLLEGNLWLDGPFSKVLAEVHNGNIISELRGGDIEMFVVNGNAIVSELGASDMQVNVQSGNLIANIGKAPDARIDFNVRNGTVVGDDFKAHGSYEDDNTRVFGKGTHSISLDVENGNLIIDY